MAEWLTRAGTRWPLIQAPMAGSQGAALAVAVAQAGGLGSIPAAMLTPQGLAEELRRVAGGLGVHGLGTEGSWSQGQGQGQGQRLGQGTEPEGSGGGGTGGAGLEGEGGGGIGAPQVKGLPVNVNFFCHKMPSAEASAMQAWHAVLAPYAAEWGIDLSTAPTGPVRQPFDSAMAEVLEIWRPAVVSFHFGLPEPALLERVKAWGARILSSATTVAEARWLEAQGVDAVIAQGLEAGGHRGLFLSEDLSTQAGTMALLPQVARAVSVPVVAAGGVADAAGVRAAFALGATAVQVGTAFLGCPEATTTAIHRQALAQAQQEAVDGGGEVATALTRLFSGRPARGLVNRLMRELGPLHTAAPPFPLASLALQPLRQKAEAAGRSDFSPLWCGQHPPRWMDRPAGEVVAALMEP